MYVKHDRSARGSLEKAHLALMECLWWQMSFCHYHGFKGLFSKSDSGSLHIVWDVCYWMILFFWKVSKCTFINTHDGCPVFPLPKFPICDFITSSKHKYLTCCSSTLTCSVPGFMNQSGSPIWPQVLQAALMGELKASKHLTSYRSANLFHSLTNCQKDNKYL